MATWITVRNMDINESNQTNRTLQFLAFLDLYLVSTLGWTRIGTGNGSSFSWSSTTTLALYPSITSPSAMALDSWGVWENPDGLQLCVKAESSTATDFWVSPGGNFVSTGVSATIPPSETGSAPADMVTMNAGNYGGSTTTEPYKITLAYTSDNTSFIIFGRRGATPNDEIAAVFIKLEDVKTDDTIANGNYPYWFFMNSTTSDSWNRAHLSTGTNAAGKGVHPSSGAQEYYLMDPYLDAVYLFDTIPVDPISGNSQRLECLVGCTISGSFHIRGKAPEIFRVSSAVHSSGDRLDDAGGGVYNYIVIGDYAVPWFSSDNLTW